MSTITSRGGRSTISFHSLATLQKTTFAQNDIPQLHPYSPAKYIPNIRFSRLPQYTRRTRRETQKPKVFVYSSLELILELPVHQPLADWTASFSVARERNLTYGQRNVNILLKSLQIPKNTHLKLRNLCNLIIITSCSWTMCVSALSAASPRNISRWVP